MRVQLITFRGCPNADAARESLRRNLVLAGLDPAFEEIDNMAGDTPESLREWASPTVLIDGADVGGQQQPTGRGCRLYRDEAGRLSGLLPESLLSEAIQRATA
jgi:hypothetical protein